MNSVKDSTVECVTLGGERIEGRLVRLGRFDAVFEISTCFDQLRTSQTLSSFKITSDKRLLYDGRATVHGLVNLDTQLICEVALDETGVSLQMLSNLETEGFDSFLKQWTAVCQIDPVFKIAVADMASLLSNLRSWMNQVEIALRSLPAAESARREETFMTRILPRIIESVNAQHERFEEQAAKIPAERQAAYQNYAARELAEYFLCAPFAYRTFSKPLGYAGDFEMMEMIHRNKPEGGSLFARALHMLLVSQWPAESVRNRISHLEGILVNETARVARSGRRAKILNLGCGPAREVREFMTESRLSDQADFTLLDFNEETITHVAPELEAVRRAAGRKTGLQMRKMSVHQVLRSAVLESRGAGTKESYDLVYCAGLFDYLADTTCRALAKLFFQQLAPGGLVVIANMDDAKPFRRFIEYVLDWYLIYRDTRQMWTLCPPEALNQAAVIAEPTAVNLFLQLRRPD